MYLKGRFVKYLILLSTWERALYAKILYVYIYIFGNQLTTQNNDKYYHKKNAQIITWQTQAQQATTAVSVSVC